MDGEDDCKVLSFLKKKTTRETNVVDNTFSGAVEIDIENLCKAASVTREEAIRLASEFYRKYPMLVEYVRDAKFLLNRK